MSVIRAMFAELFGMFVDDGSLAVAIVVLIAAVAALVKAGWLAPLPGGVLLLVGCVLILAENVRRAASRRLGRS